MTTPPLPQPDQSVQQKAMPQGTERTNGQTPPQTERPHRQAMETKLVSRLQDSIDEHGRYAPRLKDISVGFAAAKGVSEIEAKQEIAGLFQSQIGMTPQQYLENNRAERGLPNDRAKDSENDRGR